MKQIIPFKKELPFKTKCSEITSISLEHEINLKEEDLISGEFHVTGEYKMTEGSVTREKFDFILPFDITLDSRYDSKNMVTDVDDFNYEVINGDKLKVEIDLYIEGDTIKEELKEEPIMENEETSLQEKTLEEVRNDPELEINVTNTNINTNNNINTNEEDAPVVNLLDNLDNVETYVSYKVYIVKEGDTVDTILNKYQISKEDLSNYNNLEDIKPGSKIVIPALNG